MRRYTVEECCLVSEAYDLLEVEYLDSPQRSEATLNELIDHAFDALATLGTVDLSILVTAVRETLS
jgi:hypothetical protein